MPGMSGKARPFGQGAGQGGGGTPLRLQTQLLSGKVSRPFFLGFPVNRGV
jgi:hypothetical protein